MATPTLTTLNATLTAINAQTQHTKPLSKGSCETYGRQTMCYVRATTQAERFRIEGELERCGFKVNRAYWPGSAVVEVRVSYLRAFGWDK